MTHDPEDFTACTHLSDNLNDRATMKKLADVAWLLALNIG